MGAVGCVVLMYEGDGRVSCDDELGIHLNIGVGGGGWMISGARFALGFESHGGSLSPVDRRYGYIIVEYDVASNVMSLLDCCEILEARADFSGTGPTPRWPIAVPQTEDWNITSRLGRIRSPKRWLAINK